MVDDDDEEDGGGGGGGAAPWAGDDARARGDVRVQTRGDTAAVAAADEENGDDDAMSAALRVKQGWG